MTGPFQSIVGMPDPALDEQATTGVFSNEAPFDLPELFAGINGGDGSKPNEINCDVRVPAPLTQKRKPLRGGTYNPLEALKLLNDHFFVGKNDQETAIYRINDDESATFMAPDQFKLEIQNILVGSLAKSFPAEKFWRENPQRHERRIVFKPGGTSAPDEYNLWRGFGVKPSKGRQKQRTLLQHINEVICRREKAKFKYLMKSLAWAVQNPEKNFEILIVLKSRKQGTGKSTLGRVMLDIFGSHGALIDDKSRLLGRFNDSLETKCFVLAEEMFFAGDLQTADRLKSLITGETFLIERKFGSCRQIQNRLKVIATTNHDHAIAAGVRDRRNVVYDVSDERVGDRAWFDRLYRDLADGGTSEFLHLLLNLQLEGWHPRQNLRTSETAEQQRMSGDSVSQWSQACIDADAIVGAGRGSYGIEMTHDLGTALSSETLREAYTGFCKQNGLRALGPDAFGKGCTEMFGPRRRLKALQTNGTGNSKRRPWGYHVPKGTKWQEKVDARLGVKN